ncbi:MAG TPA: type II toxin-antitoxin system Phd/YefM family antitoxin [Caulobacteraceae bacterium]|nr:type II toxin-antitoxin system Phd/YefM family antitoxin [Caulobacteraceae bacterium]
MTWTLATAKDRLSEVIRKAEQEGPQTITVRGREAAVILSKSAFDRIDPSKPRRNFKEFLLAIPSLEGVDLTRDDTPAREVNL